MPKFITKLKYKIDFGMCTVVYYYYLFSLLSILILLIESYQTRKILINYRLYSYGALNIFCFKENRLVC